MFINSNIKPTMPNTIAHFGIQTLASKAIFRAADVKWIGLGCLLPDLPWITQRLLHPLHLFDPILFHIYVVIQASLFFSLLLAVAISIQTVKSYSLFLLLSLNVLFHLLLDPTQIKWGNGSLLLAPFSWQLTSFGWYWPEQLPTLLLTLAGIVVFPYCAWQDRKKRISFIRSGKRLTASIILVAAYLVLPFFFLNPLLQADIYSAATLSDKGNRAGKPIVVDRAPYQAASATVTIYSDEKLKLQGRLPEHDTTLSLQGRFIDNSTILVSSSHVHTPLRDVFSLVGILLLLASWLLALLTKRITIERP